MEKYNKNVPLYYGSCSKNVRLYDGVDVNKSVYDQVWFRVADLLEKRALVKGDWFTASMLISQHMPGARHDSVERSLTHIALNDLLPIFMVPEGEEERFKVI